MSVYYNDNDPFVCNWLQCLINKGLIPDGAVDSRSIIDVVPSDLGPFRQCHFFAGIGGWARALALASYEGECWTASLPCQPLSVAGARQGALDGRHLWPAFYRLVAVCRPPTIFGEQVASKDGREWLAGVRIDLDGLGYACGAANLPACSVGAPHRRERLYWGAVGNANGAGRETRNCIALREGSRSEQSAHPGSCGVADAASERRRRRGDEEDGLCQPSGLSPGASRQRTIASGTGHGGVADADKQGPQGRLVLPERADEQTLGPRGLGFWSDAEWRIGADGKARRTQSGIRLLAYGVPNRVGALRGLGNSIVAQVAAEFIMAFVEATASHTASSAEFEACGAASSDQPPKEIDETGRNEAGTEMVRRTVGGF